MEASSPTRVAPLTGESPTSTHAAPPRGEAQTSVIYRTKTILYTIGVVTLLSVLSLSEQFASAATSVQVVDNTLIVMTPDSHSAFGLIFLVLAGGIAGAFRHELNDVLALASARPSPVGTATT